jgi:hypothetical protein
MRGAFHNRTVLKCTRIAFIAIADHILLLTVRFAAGFQFPPRRKTGAAETPKARTFYLAYDLFRVHFKESLLKRFIAAGLEIIVNLFGSI